MNIFKCLVLIPFSIVAATFAQAACVDRGLPAFAESAHIVELCENAVCTPAKQIRLCGNIYYSAQEYEMGSEIWLFVIRKKNDDAGQGAEIAIEIRPSDTNEIPLTIVDGRPVRLLVGTPIEQAKTKRTSCIPVSGTDACDFVDAVLLGLN